jgi:hypothetical protein
VIETEGEHELVRRFVLRGVARPRPVAVRPQVLIDVSAMQIDDDVGGLDDLIGDERDHSLGLSTGRVARVPTVHALAVDGVHMHRHLLE